MDIAALIQQYGYLAVFVGSVLEGETLLVLAGLAAYRGYLSLQWVIAVAALGAFLGDQFYFFLGRRFGAAILRRWPGLLSSVARADVLLARRGAIVVVGMRFVYGVRTGGALAIGMSRMSWLRFASLNLLGVLLWAPLVAGAGYLLGNAAEPLLKHMRFAEYVIFAMVIVVGSSLWLIGRRRRKHARSIEK